MPYRTSAELFEQVDFISHAGIPLAWKIECDAIRPEWWNGLAPVSYTHLTLPTNREV